jgi:hypothetical protein
MQAVVDFPQLSSLPEQIQRLSDTVEELLKEVRGAATTPAPVEEFLTPAQAAERYHVTTLTLRNLEKRDILKGRRLGRRVLYRVSDIDAALDSNSTRRSR